MRTRVEQVLGVIALVLGPGIATPASALTTITRDTRIDARHSIRDDLLVRADGRGRSPVVEIIAGGSVSGFLIADDRSSVVLSGGAIGGHLIARESSTVTVSSGTVGMSLFANGQSAVTVSGGAIGLDLRALDRSSVTVSGGAIGADVQAFPGSRITLTGGRIGADLFAFGGSALTVSGGILSGRLFADARSTLQIPLRAMRRAEPAPVALSALRGAPASILYASPQGGLTPLPASARP